MRGFPQRLASSDRGGAGLFARAAAEQAGWSHLNMVALRLHRDKPFQIQIDQYEYLTIVLGGVCHLRTNRGDFEHVGRRRDVFDGLPHAVYLPPQTELEIEAVTPQVELVSCWAATATSGQPQRLTPSDVTTRLMGQAGTASQVTTIVGADGPTQALRAAEIYTPGGNWSPQPPVRFRDAGKADAPAVDAETLLFYKHQRRQGFGLVYVYSDQGEPFREAYPMRMHDVLLLPRGYHTLVSSPHNLTYQLQLQVGTDIMAEPDPAQAWVRLGENSPDPRLPVVDEGQEA